MDAAEKRQRDLDLLRKSRQALDEGELVDRNASPPSEERRRPGPGGNTDADADADVVMYRGKPVRRGSGGGTPGAGAGRGRGGQFRGVSTTGRKPTTPSRSDVRSALERLNELYEEGLITRSEYDRKRGQILDRL